MQNTKLIRLLKSLNQNEIRQFKDFVNSPVYNKNKNAAKLFDEIKKFYPEFTNKNLDGNKIFGKVFPDEKYDYFKLKLAVSDLFKIGIEFLSFLSFKNENQIKTEYLLRELRQRNLDSIFEQTFKSAESQNESSKVKDEVYFFHKLNLTFEHISYLAPKKPNENILMQQDMLNLFIRYSLIRYMKYYNIMMHEELQNNVKYDMGMFDEVLNYIKNNDFENSPTILAYYNIIMLGKERDDKYFYSLKELGEKYKDELNDVDRYMIFLHLNSHCAFVFNRLSRTDLLRDQFELIKEKNSQKIENLGKILYPDFLNEVKISVNAKEFEWAEDYIKNNSGELTEEKDSTINFCYGYINFKKGNYDAALDLFSKTNFPNFIIKIQVKIIQLKLLYEINCFEQAISNIDAFRHYLKRENTIKESFKESFYEFLRITNDLVKFRTDHNKKDNEYYREKILKDIDSLKSNQFGIKIWLIEKAKKLFKN
ncbi:MAG: hypothetical protein IPM38_15375 [Ignavibacteria bacterium]|nr:hypothetical protein [Ignavibacteria bacterium]